MAFLRAILVVAALLSAPMLYGLAKRVLQGAPPYSDAAATAIRQIEDKCLSEPLATVRCRELLEKRDDCDRDQCTFQAYYCAAYKAGFDDELPPLLYRDGRPLRC